MSCTTRFFGMPVAPHQWRKEVTHAEILTAQEPDMWGRTVLRDYVRCDKRQVCTVCGEIRREVSCLCEPAQADRCALRIDYFAKRAAAPR